MECVKRSRGGANQTINEELRVLNAVWECLIKFDKIPEYNLETLSRNNPVAKIDPLPKKLKRKGRVIPENELVMIFRLAIEDGQDEDIDWYGIFLTLYVGCGRKMEILSVKPHQLDLVNDQVNFFVKGGGEKLVPIHPFIKPYLAAAKERAVITKSKYLFPDHDGLIMGKNKPLNKIKELCKKAGIPKTTVHDLRRTFASNTKLSRETKIRIGGWKSKRVFDETYNNPLDEPLRQEYMKWDLNFLPKPADDYLVTDTEKTQR